MLTEQAIAASDRRVRFIGIDAYTEAGGYVMRDLFSEGEDGWLLDGTGWLPEPLRLPVVEVAEQEAPGTDLPDFLYDEDGEFDPMAIAAE